MTTTLRKLIPCMAIAGLLLASAPLSAEFTYLLNGVGQPYGSGGNMRTLAPTPVTGTADGRAYTLRALTPETPLPTTGTWPVVYGGYYALSVDANAIDLTYAFRGDTPNQLRFQHFSGSGSYYGLAYWPTPTSIAFNTDLKILINRGVGNSPTHIVVRTTTGSFYVAETPNTSAEGESTINAADTNWKLWDFAANDGNNFVVSFSDAVPVGSINDVLINAVGFYSIVNASNINVHQIAVEGTDPDAPPVPVTGVTASPQLITGFFVDETRQLTATVEPVNAADKNVVWASDDETVATVDASGLVTAVSEGLAIITVTTNDGDFTDTVEVNVTAGTANWAGYPKLSEWAYSEGLFDWLYVNNDWVWVVDMERYLYLPESYVTDDGTWFFISGNSE